MRKTDSTEKLTTLIKVATSPFHTAAAIVKELRTAGFEPLVMNRPWQLEAGGKYYVEQYGSAVAVFTIGEDEQTEGFRIAAAHTDFPGLRVKQHAELMREGYAQLNVEVYGGAILNTWLDRPLSAAGRVALKSDDVFHPQMRLIDLKRPVFIIPNLAIHLNREVNKGVELNRQKDLLPLAGMGGEQMSDQFFRELLAKELHVQPEESLDYEI